MDVISTKEYEFFVVMTFSVAMVTRIKYQNPYFEPKRQQP